MLANARCRQPGPVLHQHAVAEHNWRAARAQHAGAQHTRRTGLPCSACVLGWRLPRTSVAKTKSSSFRPQLGREDMSPTTEAPTPMICVHEPTAAHGEPGPKTTVGCIWCEARNGRLLTSNYQQEPCLQHAQRIWGDR